MQMATSIEGDNGEMIVKRVSVPIGLEELMEGLTKEVILKKPKDICVFASEYFANLLNLREQGSLKGVPGKRIRSITKQFAPNNVAKQLKIKSKSVDPKILSRQISIQPDSPTKRTLTTKKIVLNSKEEKDKAAEKTKNFLDKRKARKGSRDENNKISRQASLGQNDKKERRISRTSSTSTEDSTRSIGKGSQERKKISSSRSDKLSPRKSVDAVSNLSKIGTVITKDTPEITQKSEVSTTNDKSQDSEHLSDILSNKESSTEKETSNVDISDVSVSEDGKNQKSEDVVVGCTMKCEGAVDTTAENLQELKLATPSFDVEAIATEQLENEDAKLQAKKEVDDSIDEVDLQRAESRTEKLEDKDKEIHEEKEVASSIDEVTVQKNEVVETKLNSAENDIKTESEDLKKTSSESNTNLKNEPVPEESPIVELPGEITSSDVLEKTQTENKSDPVTENNESVATDVEYQMETDKSKENAKSEISDGSLKPETTEVEETASEEDSKENQVNESNDTQNKNDSDHQIEEAKLETCDGSLKPEATEVEKAASEEDSKENRVNESTDTQDKNDSDHQIEQVKLETSGGSLKPETTEVEKVVSEEDLTEDQINKSNDAQNKNDFDLNKNKEINISNEVLENQQNNTEANISANGTEEIVSKDQENKENIDTNKETKYENKDVSVDLSKALTGIAESTETKESSKTKEAAKLKNNRTKSSSDDYLKTKDSEAGNKKVKRVKSVDSSTKILKKTKSKSRLTSANEEKEKNTNDTIKKRDKRSASVDAANNNTTLKTTKRNSFDSQKLREQIKEVGELSQTTAFKTSYNPYKLRQEIKQASENGKINEKDSMSDIAAEIAAAIRIQSIWRGFSSRKQIRNTHHVKAITDITDVPINEKILEEVVDTKATSLKESTKLENKTENDKDFISGGHNDLSTTEKKEEAKDHDVMVNENSKIMDDNISVAKPDVHVGKENDLNKVVVEDKEKSDQNLDESIGDKTVKENLVSEEVLAEKNDKKENVDGVEQKILPENNLESKILDKSTEDNVLTEDSTESSVKQEKDGTSSKEIEVKGEEKHNENKATELDGNQDETKEQVEKTGEESSLREKIDNTDDEKLNEQLSSEMKNDAVPKTDLQESKEDSVVSSTENDKNEKENDAAKKYMSEKSIEEEITRKLTSGLNLESAPQLQISELDKQAKDETTKQAKEQLDLAIAVVRIQALWRGFKVRHQLKNEKVFGATVKKEIKDKEALKTVACIRAVAKIQALWRGYKVRKNIKEVNTRLNELQKPAECDEMPSQRELSDEDIFNAAAKIQAGVRGYMVRKKRDVCHLNSISEETTPDLQLTDEQIVHSVGQLEDVPSNSPEMVNNDTTKEDFTNNATNKDGEETGKEVKNNAAPNTEEDHKKTENEVKFIASELNSSTPNKLSNLDTSAIIDDSISNGNVNKDEADPDSSVIHDEPDYEDAPTRPVTSDTEPTNNQDTEDVSKENVTKNDQLINEDENLKKNNKIVDINKTDKGQEDKQKLFSSQESATSVDSVATVIFNDTETKSGSGSEDERDGKLSAEKQEIQDEEIKNNTEENIKEESNEMTNDKESDTVEKTKQTETLKEHEQVDEEKVEVQNLAVKETINNLNKDHIENFGEINNNSNDGATDISLNVQNTENIPDVVKVAQLSEESKVINNKEKSNLETEEKDKDLQEENKHAEEKTLSETSSLENDNVDSKSDNKSKTSSGNAIDQPPMASGSNKVNVSTLENEIKTVNKSLETSRTLSDDSVSKEKTNSEDTLSDVPISQLSLESTNNKLNVSEVENANKHLQDLTPKSSEELTENQDTENKESSADVSTAEDIKTENSLTSSASPSEPLSELHDENQTKGEDKERLQSGKDILRIHIPLRELSEIKEEDGEVKSSTGSVEDLDDESKTLSVNQEMESKSEESTNEKLKDDVIEARKVESENQVVDDKVEAVASSKSVEKTEEEQREAEVRDESLKLEQEEFVKTQTTQEEPRQKSPVATINLVHSGEFHDTITVPIVLTPPTSASPKEPENQVIVRQSSPPGLVNTGELHDNVLPVSVQLNEAPPAGAKVLTSQLSDSISADGQDPAQASNKDASTCGTQSDNTTSSAASMETEKRNNATTIPKKNMESEAATKIQAGFRGYQVRKQLKSKVSSPGDISNQRRSARRKSSGRIAESGRISQNKSKPSADVEEKSAVKIQAGVRGFLVRRRQKKQKQGKESS